jgi:hypothetical protein
MATGYLRCLGSPLHLKNKLGKGYQLTATFADGTPEILATRRRNFMELVKRDVSPGAELLDSFKGDSVLPLTLPHENLQIARVFDLLQEQKLREYGILDWSIAQTSLNEVFLRIVEEAEENDALKQGTFP